jgi:2-oxo-4-hydroxy-4-carboxy-5-ureidoimidazoline decarboxylase
MDLAAKVNGWTEADARMGFRACCDSTRWAERMTAARPFVDEAALLAAAEENFQNLGRADWLEAFAAHPQIGDMAALRAKFGHESGWPAGEQAGIAAASETVLQALAKGNADYEARFGYIFIVCATGKTAAEMLALLQTRLGNDPKNELAIAAAEQQKITYLRLRKLSS